MKLYFKVIKSILFAGLALPLIASCSKPLFSAGLSTIVFTSNMNDNWDIYTILSDGSNLKRIRSFWKSGYLYYECRWYESR
jgi:hypothetical protein